MLLFQREGQAVAVLAFVMSLPDEDRAGACNALRLLTTVCRGLCLQCNFLAVQTSVGTRLD